MAKLTKFSINPSGELVYSKTGAKARGNFEIKGSNVYKNGRRYGTISKSRIDRKTKTALKKAKEKEKRSRQKARSKAKKKVSKKPTKKRIAEKKQPEKAVVVLEGESFEETLGNTEFSDEEREYDQAFADSFGEMVKGAMHKDLPQWLKSRIQALDNNAILEAYKKNQYVFEVYFQYNPDGSLKSADNSARWVLSWVEQIEKMGVKE